MTEAQKELNRLLSLALTGRSITGGLPEESLWPELEKELQKHKTQPMVYDLLAEENVPAQVLQGVEKAARSAALQSYHLLFTAKYLIGLLEGAGIPVALLKGASTARYYAVPEMRKSGDIDLLLLDQRRLNEAEQLFLKAGLTMDAAQHANHHTAWRTPEDIEVELHTGLTEAFHHAAADACIQRQTDRIPKTVPRADLLGVSLPVLPAAYEAYHLLLHMLQHFVDSGFGIRLLCDWVVFWNRPVLEAEAKQFLALVHECGLDGFLSMITSVCVRELGLAGCEGGLRVAEDRVLLAGGETFCALQSREAYMDFLEDIFNGGEFGAGEQGRLVAMQGKGLWGYVRSFHQQMCRNHPRASRCMLLWPVLWVVTLVVFLRNNRRLNRGSALKVISSASKRGKIKESMKLFTKA